MLANRFFYVSAGLLCLAFAYHLGARSATAQAGSTITGFAIVSTNHYVMTPNGDVYHRSVSNAAGPYATPPTLVGNFWDMPTAAQRSSFGAVKARYR